MSPTDFVAVAATAVQRNGPLQPLEMLSTSAEVLGRPIVRSAQYWTIALSTLGRPRKLAFLACFAACFAAFFTAAEVGKTDLNVGKVLLGPLHLQGGVALLEQLPQTEFARLRLVTHGGSGLNDADLVRVLDLMARVVKRKKPFTVCWDFRTVALPQVSKQQFRMIRDWVGEYLLPWDTYAQAHSLLVSNVVVRAFLSLVVRVFKPPQPVRITKDDAIALEFAQSCCKEARSYVKSDYNLKAEDRAFGAKLFG